MPLTGATEAFGLYWGNLYKGDRLQEMLTGSKYLEYMTFTCGQLKQCNPECHDCRWKDYRVGGDGN